ncbi:chlorophyll A-B binding protein [Aureococcus anophagefferens]|nr:chlorophyll A-B binding protein [Aureococcus anophagefferens]
MARCASAAPAYGSGAYRAFLAALAAGWCVVLLRGFRQCFKELKRFRRAKRSRDHLLAHLPFGVGAAFFLVAALRLGYCAKLLAAARGPACGEDAALHDAAEPLLLVALSSISLYWWQLADSHARMAPANSRKIPRGLRGFNVVFCASGVVAALLARRSDALAARDARTFWLYAVALPAVELPVAALASFLGFRTNYDELDVARSRSIYERAGARLSAAGRRLSGLVALPRLRSAGSGSDPLGSPQAPASQKASVVVKDSIGVDPGPIEPSGLFWEDKESLAAAVEIKHGRIAMTAFIGMMVQELGITFPVHGRPQNLPGGYDGSAGTIPGGYPFTTQIEDPHGRALTCELQNGRAAMLGVTGAMMHSQLDSCDHHFFYPITHNCRARPTDRCDQAGEISAAAPKPGPPLN